jgi:hypothetical protein
MDLNVIAMDATAAEQAFREYRAAFMKHRNQIDGELMRGYKLLAQGKKLISLTEAMATAGLNDQGLPAIAVNRADESFVLLDVGGWRVNYRDTRGVFYNNGARQPIHPISVQMPAGVVTPKQNQRAVAPIIPPKYRPPFKLENYHLLWEVDRWTTNPQPRRDPALLKHLGGDLYAVLAVWDLTELESRILGLLRT